MDLQPTGTLRSLYTRLYTGYEGPATGQHHARLMAELESLIERLLAPSGASISEG